MKHIRTGYRSLHMVIDLIEDQVLVGALTLLSLGLVGWGALALFARLYGHDAPFMP